MGGGGKVWRNTGTHLSRESSLGVGLAQIFPLASFSRHLSSIMRKQLSERGYRYFVRNPVTPYFDLLARKQVTLDYAVCYNSSQFQIAIHKLQSPLGGMPELGRWRTLL